MKKRGSALATVLIIFSALLILGTVVSSAVVNTNKFNSKYSDNIDLELAAKSGLNIAVEDFVKNATSKEEIANYIGNKDYIDSIYNEVSQISIGIVIEKETNKVTIKSKATDITNSTTSKEYNKVININYNSDGSVEDIVVIKPENFINVKNDIEIKQNSQSDILQYISSGGKIDLNNQIVDKESNLNLRDLSVSIDVNNSNKFINDIEIDLYSGLNLEENTNLEANINYDKEIQPSAIRADDLSVIQNQNVRVNGALDLWGKGIETIHIINGTFVIDGNIKSNQKLNIILDNSKIIVKGSIEIESGLNIILTKNSIMNVKQRIYSKGEINVNLEDSKLIVSGSGVECNNIFKCTLKNSYIFSKERLYTANGMELDLFNSNILVKENGIVSNNYFKSILSENSNIITKSNINVNNSDTNIKLNNSKIIVKEQGIDSSSGKLTVTLENSMLYIKNKIYARNNTNIISNNSNIIVGDIDISNELEVNLFNSAFIVNEKIYSGTGINLTLENSGMVVIGSINSPNNINKYYINNNGKSFILVLGKMYFNKINIYNNAVGFVPDNKSVINFINTFLYKY